MDSSQLERERENLNTAFILTGETLTHTGAHSGGTVKTFFEP